MLRNAENVPLKPMSNRYFIALIGLILMLTQLMVRDTDDRFNRPINGDAKGYYAYLPAIFIYNDPTFSFIHAIEKKYYPEDGSQFKDFLNEQPNGRQVNKTFPGIAIGYAPFFGLAWLIAELFDFATDGYSLPFQWSIVAAHLCFILVGLYFLIRYLQLYEVKRPVIQWLCFAALFGTNTWYYVVYDQSVSHVFNFMLAATFIFVCTKWLKSAQLKFAGFAILILSMLVISRPTNALILLFLPFLGKLNKVSFREMLIMTLRLMEFGVLKYILLAILVVSLPLVLWKWQTDYWLVYSYNEEGFQFLKPHFLSFLFSYQKGWLIWSPLIAIAISASFFGITKSNRLVYLFFYMPLLVIIYVFSSWWCWTYGAGFGQRPMIEFLPFLVLFVAVTLLFSRLNLVALTIILPFSFLSAFQGYQIANSIEVGGETTSKSYWNHFLQWKKDEPQVHLADSLKFVNRSDWRGNMRLDGQHPFSSAIQLTLDSANYMLIVRAEIEGEHRDTSTRIVFSSRSGWYYSKFLGDDLYAVDFRKLSYAVPFQTKKSDTLDVYLWNGSTNQSSRITRLSIESWK